MNPLSVYPSDLERFAEIVRKDYSFTHAQMWLKRFDDVIKAEREACAITAWSTGMDLHMKQYDAREIGSACAKAIRARGNE